MDNLPWTREHLVAGMRRDVWRYLSPASSIDEDAAQASALFRLPLSQVRALARVQFVISREVRDMLEAVPRLLRQLSSISVAQEEATRGRLRGRVLWGLTYGARGRSGEPHIFVTAPAQRSYDLPENRLLRFMLDAVTVLGAKHWLVPRPRWRDRRSRYDRRAQPSDGPEADY